MPVHAMTMQTDTCTVLYIYIAFYIVLKELADVVDIVRTRKRSKKTGDIDFIQVDVKAKNRK